MKVTSLAVLRPALILATDLDGTFAGGPAEARARLQAVLGDWPGAVLIYATGRSVGAARALMQETALPAPSVLIADVGTTCVDGRSLAPIAALEPVLGRDWPGGDAVRARVAAVRGVVEQEVRAPRRVSFLLEEGGIEEAAALVRRSLAGLTVDVVWSADRYLDVLPAGVNKGTTLARAVTWLGAAAADVVVAGDTLNDLALFDAGYRGIVVGNGEPALRERVRSRRTVYCARADGAAGILEGLVHLGWLEEPDA